MKMAVQFWRNRGASGRTRFGGFRHGYHGDSIGTMSVSAPESSFHWMFKGVLPNQIVRDLPRDATALADFDAFLAKEAGSLAAATLVPLVPCVGGRKLHTPAVLPALPEAGHRNDLLLVLADHAPGFGRPRP